VPFFLLGLGILGCQGSPSITSVTVTADQTTIAASQVANLAATLIGTGDFESDVTWSIDGGGTGLMPSGLSATYTAPAVSVPLTVVIRATANADPQVSGSVTITVTPF
jgi:hypothetical protein